jgi:hypothetical protein
VRDGSIRYQAPIELNRLANKFKSDKGDLYYHLHSYTRVYDWFLSPLKQEEITILEIGLRGPGLQTSLPGGPSIQAPSLFMWFGVFLLSSGPLDSHSRFLESRRSERFTFTRADQSDRFALGKLVQRCRYAIEVVVDDGSHASKHQLISVAFYFLIRRAEGFISSTI